MVEVGAVVMAWVSYSRQFGTVEVIEHETESRYLAVCVQPLWREYGGRFVVVLYDPEMKMCLVVPRLNYGVLYSEHGDEVPTFAFDSWYKELEREGLTEIWEAQREREQEQERERQQHEDVSRPRRSWSCRLRSVRFGPGVIDMNGSDVIVNASGEYALFVGMEFWAFLRGMKQNDTTTKYRRISDAVRGSSGAMGVVERLASRELVRRAIDIQEGRV